MDQFYLNDLVDSDCSSFLDGSVYLSLYAYNIKLSDLAPGKTKIYCDGKSLGFTVIPDYEIRNGIRNYLIKLDASSTFITDSELEFEIDIAAIPGGKSDPVSLYYSGDIDYYLDTTKIDGLKLDIMPFGSGDPPKPIAVQIYARVDWDPFDLIPSEKLPKQTLTCKNGRYTFNLPTDAYLFENDDIVYIGLFTDPESEWPDRIVYLYRYNILDVLMPSTDDNEYYGYVSMDFDSISTDLDGRTFIIDKNYIYSPNYKSTLNLTLVDAAFKPVEGVTIDPEPTTDGIWEYLYKFTATKLLEAGKHLEAGKTYYLRYGNFLLAKLTAVDSLGDYNPPEDGRLNEVYGPSEITADNVFWFSVVTPLSNIKLDEWSVELTNIKTNETTEYSYKKQTLISYDGDDSQSQVWFETKSPIDQGFYKAKYYRNGTEIVAVDYEGESNDGFYSVGPQIVIVAPGLKGDFRIDGWGLWYNQWNAVDRGFSVLGIKTKGALSPTLNAKFYQVTTESFNYSASKVLPLSSYNDENDTYFRCEASLGALNSALSPGYYYVVISDDKGFVHNTQYLLLTTRFFDVSFFTITVKAGVGGKIEPNRNVDVLVGDSYTFTIIADKGYKIVSVKVDGVDKEVKDFYTFEDVTKNHTIEATFAFATSDSDYYIISAKATTGGSINPSGNVVVASGADKMFDISADSGYKIASVKVNGVDKGPISSYTFRNVTTYNEIEATFTSTGSSTNDNTKPSSGGGGGGGGNNTPTVTAPGISEQVPLATANPFIDVKSTDWFYDDVLYAFTKDLFKGTSENTFSPHLAMTRGMLVTVLGRLHKVDVSDFTTSSFTDVNPSQYYAPYIEWAKESGIVMGIGDNVFAPDEMITRQDLAVIIVRYMEFAKIDIPMTRMIAVFADSDLISEYANNAIQDVFNSGIMTGKPDNIFDPKGNTTRAEVAAVLHRFAEKAHL